MVCLYPCSTASWAPCELVVVASFVYISNLFSPLQRWFAFATIKGHCPLCPRTMSIMPPVNTASQHV